MIEPVVYILADSAGNHKIGASYNGLARVRQIYSPLGKGRWAVACTKRHPMAYRIEATAHRSVADRRLVAGKAREWFSITEAEARAAIIAAWKEVAGTDCELVDACPSCRGFGSTRHGMPCVCKDLTLKSYLAAQKRKRAA